MIKCVSALTLCLLLFWLNTASAQSTSLRLCYNAEKGKLSARRRCKRKWTTLTVDNMADVLGVEDGEDGEDATALFATVDSEITLLRGSGVTSVTSTSAPVFSTYTVTFEQDISNCTYIATIDNEDDPNDKLNYSIFTRLSSIDNNSVIVAVIDPDFPSLVKSDFHLAVFCPESSS